MEINLTHDRRVLVSVTTTLEEFAQALRTGRLVIELASEGAFAGDETAMEREGAQTGLSAQAVAGICRRYGPDSLAANLLWEVAQAGEDGITSTELKEVLGLGSSQKLAGVFSGIGKTLQRFLAGRKSLFLRREWLPGRSEYLYRMPAEVRATVLAHYR